MDPAAGGGGVHFFMQDNRFYTRIQEDDHVSDLAR
jgi:hypothetical protein